MILIILALSLACWAPDLAPPDPARDIPSGGAARSARRDLPDPPFVAWTRAAPLTLVGPGGASVTRIDRPGVELTVLQVLPVRVRVRCTGCPPPGTDAEGWLQVESITTAPPGRPGG